MSVAWPLVLMPLLAAIVLAAVPHREAAGWINFGAAIATFLLACRLPWELVARPPFLIDRPAAHFAILAGFVAIAGAWFGRSGGRLQYAVFQLLLGFSLIALLANSFFVAWIGIEASVIATAVAIGLPLTTDAVAAAWRFFLPCAVGVALALFGGVVLYFAERSAFDGGLLNLAFALIAIGYGIIVVLAPMPGGVQLAPLLVILRMRALLAGHAEPLAPGPPLMALGLAALLVTAFVLWRESEKERRLEFAAVGQLGVAIFAFGVGSTAAVFAGLLQLTLLTVTRAAMLGWPLAMAGLFPSLFLIITATVENTPWLVLPLGIGIAANAWVLLARSREIQMTALAPALLLAVVVVLGIAMPGPLAGWFTAVAASLQ